VLEKLAAFDTDLRERALRRAGNAAAQVFMESAKMYAPVYTGSVAEGHPPPGTLKRSIIVKRVEEDSGPYRERYIVTVRRGGKVDAYYAEWVERGHFVKPKGMTKYAHRKSRERGTTTAQFVAPNPFMRPAYLTAEQEAFAAAELELIEALDL